MTGASDVRREPKRRRKWLWAAFAVLVVATPVALLCFLLQQARREADFTSCRNHATFVGIALDAHAIKRGRLPHEPGLSGEDIFCQIDFKGNGQNCHAGAPGQGHGGWQMVNASPESWDEILRTMKGKVIPVIWCGRPHKPGEPWAGTVRVVIAFGVSLPAPPSLGELIERDAGVDSDGVRHLDYFRSSIVYGMPEEELKARVAEINAILRKNGEPETPINIAGRRDYMELARPFQTIPKP